MRTQILPGWGIKKVLEGHIKIRGTYPTTSGESVSSFKEERGICQPIFRTPSLLYGGPIGEEINQRQDCRRSYEHPGCSVNLLFTGIGDG